MGVCSGRLKKGGLQCGPNSKKGVLGAGQVKGGGGSLPRYTPIGSTCKVMQALSDFYFPSSMAWGPTLTPIRARASSLFLTNQCLLD